ncbi:adenosylmethionine--8-amino-7-oxononanoate transaminase [Hydrogenimonas cancrithermarum]|uniref:Adenosylmethionine-8-amino-7-oxononanoate aminotransferase n=1 Tax=Hydrogenimonas cancrithermarum TaxID=2993563 RepID=A0ABN6WSH0_9BACT|nr:adenosylmethionine--8-amino-7-oxononanoate transaminase [Hydrogenimonas cancrithermarum]BDY12114.1 adenosylmethionine-8-amino-7-oxononanoate aminotransferase [Hydrogenimonas cancrithermarum]
MKNSEMTARDLAHIWHPCTQMKDHETLPVVPVKSAQGVWLEDFEGNRYIDGISSWWVNLFGHANPYISGKLSEQARTLEHVLLAGFTHEPAVRLAERLCAIAPGTLNRLFFADNGSSAVEVALKMSYHAHLNNGETRPLFLSLSNSYHGETIGALSVGDVELYKKTYEPILIRSIQTPVPEDRSEAAAHKAADALETLLRERGSEISAMILEPLVQCAGNMHMYHPVYLRLAKTLCERHGIHFIADEIAVGFGRTGTMFACEQAGITPDFMCLSKGLTGGYMPLAVVLTSDEIYGAFYCDYLEYKAFLHSHSYTGNPLGCACANAVLDIFENENVIGQNREKAQWMAEFLKPFEALDNVEEVRQTGMIAAVELKGYPPQERVNLKIFDYCLKHGVFVRPLGNVLYFMPPYIISYEEMRHMIQTTYDAVKSL